MKWMLGGLLACCFVSGVAATLIAQDGNDAENQDVRQAPKPIDHRKHKVGKLIPDLAFTDADGKEGKLSEFKDHKVLVIAISTVGCPICKKFAPILEQIRKDYAEKDVTFLLLNPMEDDSVEDIRASVAARGMKARCIVDPKGQVASALGAQTTGDCFVLDASRTLRYRGAVSDQFGFGYNLDKPRKTYLRDAIDALLNDEDVYTKATWAPGCVLDLEGTPPTGDITWHNRVSRIVQENCQECHRDGQNGPFELMTYKQVKSNRAMVKRQVKARLMPPWFANPKHGDFRNDRSLTDDDRGDLLKWIDNGCPEGDPKDAVTPRKWPEDWQIGTPDAIVQAPKEYTIPATGTVPYKYSFVTTTFDEDKWISAMEIRPSSPQVVHHVLIFLQYPRKHPRFKEQPQHAGGIGGYFMGMVPGQGKAVYPKNMGKFLPKGATMVFQIHYTTNGEETKDRTSIGMKFHDKRPEIEVQTAGISNVLFRIPPGDDNHKVVATKKIRKKSRILGFLPHMHVRGKAYRYEVVYPDGKREVLLDVPKYDFNWQLYYELREPIDLPKGSRIIATGWFDNSDKNPANPDPKKEVRFGEQTWEEMQIGYVDWYPLED